MQSIIGLMSGLWNRDAVLSVGIGRAVDTGGIQLEILRGKTGGFFRVFIMGKEPGVHTTSASE